MIKRYIKWKLIALIKDMLLNITNEKHSFSQRANEWKNKVNTNKNMSENRFEKIKNEQITWSYDQYKMYHHKYEAVSEVLKLIETL